MAKPCPPTPTVTIGVRGEHEVAVTAMRTAAAGDAASNLASGTVLPRQSAPHTRKWPGVFHVKHTGPIRQELAAEALLAELAEDAIEIAHGGEVDDDRALARTERHLNAGV